MKSPAYISTYNTWRQMRARCANPKNAHSPGSVACLDLAHWQAWLEDAQHRVDAHNAALGDER